MTLAIKYIVFAKKKEKYVMFYFILLFSRKQKDARFYPNVIFDLDNQINHSENVNGMVTTVFPDEILPKVHLLTAFFMSLSKSSKPVVDDSIMILIISPFEAIAIFNVTFP